jgi:DNA polymerase III delta prime subunit
MPLHFLFFGGVGVGKTTMCRILVHSYYANDPTSIQENVLFINTLKDQGVAYYRTEVKCFCQTRCSVIGKKKVVVIDNADLISEQGQQVFLSLLDAYGKVVMFLATCCNPSKIIDNLHSRMTALRLTPFEPSYLKTFMGRVVEGEGMAVDEDAVDDLVSRCEGSVRLLLNFLERFKLLGGRVTRPLVLAHCCNVQEAAIHDLIYFLKNGDFASCIRLVKTVHVEGYSTMDFLDAFFKEVKTGSYGLTEAQKYKAVKTVAKYICVVNNVHDHPVEMVYFLNEIGANFKEV